jgi:hypothetical protein
MDTQTIDLLFLELSQVTKATTAKELSLLERVRDLEEAMRPFAELVETTAGRIPVERLCAADWHKLAKAYRRA